MTAKERAHLFNVVLVEMLAAFAVVMVVLIALFVAGRFDEPPGVWICNTASECTRLMS